MGDVNADLGIIEAIKEVAPALVASRYFIVITVTLALYDHLITFSDEVEYIWNTRKWLSKFIFIVNRYVVELTLVGITYVTIGLRPPLSNDGCKMYLIPVVSSTICCMAVSHLMITLRVDALWDSNRRVTFMTVGAFISTYSVAVAFFIVFVNGVQDSMHFFPPINACISQHSPRPLGKVWAAMVAFDVFAFGLVLVNAVDRPYRRTSDVVSSLKKDGFIFFLAILVIRAFNLAFSESSTLPEASMVAYFAWALISIATCRLTLRTEAAEIQGKFISGVQVWNPNAEHFELKPAVTNSSSACHR